MLRSYRPCRNYPAIVIALALIAVCQNAHADQGQHADTNAEAVPLEAVLGRNAFDLDRILEIEPEFLEDIHHHHSDDIQSVAITVPNDLDPDAFMPWITEFTQKEGATVLRCKGILSFKDEPKRFVFQGVHMLLDGDLQSDWKPGEKRQSKMVFIGRGLNRAAIEKAVEACRAA